mmetsp:Transcript_22877/g.26901  ORF Transcript_22877/g.26901 Transcript_22877/m.26901 type:complete len:409 (+) Transcript_22877:153-1379(+)
MGVTWSKEEDPCAEGPLNKEVLIYIFEYLGSLDELVQIALVNRWWASLIGSNIIQIVVQRMNIKAWYNQDSIKALRNSNGAEVCHTWHSSPKMYQHLLNAFPFPSTLKSKIPTDSDISLSGPWSALGAKGGEPRIVKSKSGKKVLQFVNLTGLHPVHLRTPSFEHPLQQPITIICVGIAFEDATFVSGINDRFEVCHSYPNINQPDLERAPVSITAHPVGDSSDSDDDPIPSCILSGNTQPGEWHVYTAVFNEDGSELYVDGRREGGAQHSNVGVGMLDGLTIGADHRNDFPLGSTVESSIPGVIGELIIFGSILPAEDRRRIERKLMIDHHIELPTQEREEDRARYAQAHRMLMERAPGRKHKQIPLRYLARHNDVSWSIQHPVTGDKIRPKRIGVRETAESSGWED